MTFRSWTRAVMFMICAVGSVVLGASLAAAGPTFRTNSISVKGASVTIGLSPDREVVTVIASDLAAALKQSSPERELRREATLQARLADARSGARLHLTIEAWSDIQPGVRAVLLVRVNGARRRFRMPVGAGGPGKLEATFKLSGASRLAMTVEIVMARPKGSRALGLMGVDSIEATLRPL